MNMKKVLQRFRLSAWFPDAESFLHTIRKFFNSYTFYVFQTMAACLFVWTGQEVAGAVCFVVLICLILVVCDDILPTTLPFLLISAFTTNCYDSFDLFFPYIRYAPAALLCLVFHFTVYRGRMQTGESAFGIMAVSVAILLGGIGGFSLRDYAIGAYYYLGLSVGMLAVYYLMRSQFFAKRDYDLSERFSVIMLLLGLHCTFIIASGYYKNYLGLTEPPYILGFSRNNISTLLMFAMPFPLFLTKKHPCFALFTPALYAAIAVTTSRGGLLFGSLEFLACCAYWVFFGQKRLLRAVLCLGAIFLILLCFGKIILDVIQDRILADDVITNDARYKMLLESVVNFKKNPIFGTGILDDSIYYGEIRKKGSMAWYHMMIPQIVGSMGLVGVAAYAFQAFGRIRLIFRRPDPWSLCLGISYLGILGMSQVNPGEFCPLPFELLTVLLFILQERRLAGPRLPLSGVVG